MKRVSLVSVIIGVFVSTFILAAAIFGKGGVGAALSLQDRAAVKETIEVWTQDLEEKDYTGWLTHWNEDAVLMPPEHPRVEGRQQIEGFVRQNFGNVAQIVLSDWKIEGRGSLAVVTNDVSWDGETASQVIVLRKHPEGAWRVQTVIFNSNKPK